MTHGCWRMALAVLVLTGCGQLQPVLSTRAPLPPAAPRQPATPVPTPADRPQARYTLKDLTPARIAGLLKPAPAAGWADDESETAVQASSWFGWWGGEGRIRALKAFSQEEGAAVQWLDVPGGHSALYTSLGMQDMARLIAMGTNPAMGRTPVTINALPNRGGFHAIRHLKLFRRQKVVSRTARSLVLYRIDAIVPPQSAPGIGYIALARQGNEIFAGLYQPDGKLMIAVASNKAIATPDPVSPPADTPDPTDPNDPTFR